MRQLPEPDGNLLTAWIAKWEGRYAKLVAWVEENIEETPTFYRLPAQHHKHLMSTNMLERLNEELNPPFPSDVELSPGAAPMRSRTRLKTTSCAKGDRALVTFATFHKLQAALERKGLTNFTATKLMRWRERERS